MNFVSLINFILPYYIPPPLCRDKSGVVSMSQEFNEYFCEVKGSGYDLYNVDQAVLDSKQALKQKKKEATKLPTGM